MTDPSMSGLMVEGLRVTFGGLVAVDGVSFHAPPGRITGLIGPNGAGKSTSFSACSGLVRPAAGRISFDGVDITTAAPAKRALAGIGRSFQRMELFESLTVADNVALGREAALAGRSPVTQLVQRRRERELVARVAAEAMERCGVERWAAERVATLSTGQRRLVEIARALAGDFRLLLLDEPSSGLDVGESAQLGDLLQSVVRDRGIGILIVEHDMALVSRICEYLYVLDFGRLIHEGTAADVLESDIVRAAYLGDERIEHLA